MPKLPSRDNDVHQRSGRLGTTHFDADVLSGGFAGRIVAIDLAVVFALFGSRLEAARLGQTVDDGGRADAQLDRSVGTVVSRLGPISVPIGAAAIELCHGFWKKKEEKKRTRIDSCQMKRKTAGPRAHRRRFLPILTRTLLDSDRSIGRPIERKKDTETRTSHEWNVEIAGQHWLCSRFSLNIKDPFGTRPSMASLYFWKL